MSVKRTVKLDLDAADVIKKLDRIEKELEGVKKGVDENTQEMGQLGKATAATADEMGTLAGGIGVVALALKALAISTVLRGFDMFFTVLRNNQIILDATNTAFETLNIFMKGLINDIVRVTTTGVVKDFFESFNNTIPIKEMTNAVIRATGKLGFFLKALELVGQATGFNRRLGEAKALADQIVELRNEVLLAEADQRILQLTYQREAEIQRQIRDDIRKTPEERLKANERLGEILQEQLAEEQKVAEKRLELALLEQSTDEENVQFKVNVKNAIADLAEVKERITSQESEQLTNQASLEEEVSKVTQEGIEKVITLRMEGAEQNEISVNKEMQANKKRVDDAKQTSDSLIEIEKLTADAKRNIVANTLDDIAELMGSESKEAKALAIASTLINTYSAATAALAAPPVGAGPIFGPIAAVGAIASGLANVAKIRATKLPYGDDGGLDSGPQPSVPQGLSASLIPNLEGIQGTPVGEVAPVQAFVVENDISSAQALQEELDIQSTL
ncbi:MAG: hypothetical protein Unbinned585contig1001_35 [Prokaryotic dsDNA virus sp.]|nr:MAG: hypothetical protein Unbinned585contig1001_35 [Prokaryotic dsDNA virus sp.]|tara:strand:- start:1073 stop:2587 length:1515 start_codon:yes stop_codon:yes gene_type:complete